MSDAIYLDRTFSTNGVEFAAGKLTVENIKSMVRGPRGGQLTDDAAKEVQQELLQRQAKYHQYSKGIHERHEHTHDAGTMAVGSGAE